MLFRVEIYILFRDVFLHWISKIRCWCDALHSTTKILGYMTCCNSFSRCEVTKRPQVTLETYKPKEFYQRLQNEKACFNGNTGCWWEGYTIPTAISLRWSIKKWRQYRDEMWITVWSSSYQLFIQVINTKISRTVSDPVNGSSSLLC